MCCPHTTPNLSATCPETLLPLHTVSLSSRHCCGKHPSYAHRGLFWAHHVQHRQRQREECFPYPAQFRYSTKTTRGSSKWEGASACSAITRLTVPQKGNSYCGLEHSPHLYTSKLNNISIWTWTLICHCPEVVSTAPTTILVPPNWTFPPKLLGLVQDLSEARTTAKMQSGCSPCLRWQVQPNDTSYVGASEPGTRTAALYSLLCT